MIAACRYFTISNGVENYSENRLVRFFFFTKRGAVCLISGMWLYFIFITGFLAVFNQMGKDKNGFCGTKPFTSIALFAFYLIGFQSFTFLCNTATIVYSTKLTRFMKLHAAHVGSEETKETKDLLRMLKMAAAQPFLFQFIPICVLLLSDLDLIILPIALGRICALIFALASLIDPWLTILILPPFRREFEARFVAKIVKRRANSISTTQMLQQPTITGSQRMRAPSVVVVHRS
jgi:hypothetical protein